MKVKSKSRLVAFWAVVFLMVAAGFICLRMSQEKAKLTELADGSGAGQVQAATVVRDLEDKQPATGPRPLPLAYPPASFQTIQASNRLPSAYSVFVSDGEFGCRVKTIVNQ